MVLFNVSFKLVSRYQPPMRCGDFTSFGNLPSAITRIIFHYTIRMDYNPKRTLSGFWHLYALN